MSEDNLSRLEEKFDYMENNPSKAPRLFNEIYKNLFEKLITSRGKVKAHYNTLLDITYSGAMRFYAQLNKPEENK